jgi:hypothetical protein
LRFADCDKWKEEGEGGEEEGEEGGEGEEEEEEEEEEDLSFWCFDAGNDMHDKHFFEP